MKFLIVLASLSVVTFAQRPTYAGSSPIGQPGLASRFKDTASSTEVPVANRLGEDTSSSSTTTNRIPVDARGDHDLVNRLNQWPREHQPFWLLNAPIIENHRRPQDNSRDVANGAGAGIDNVNTNNNQFPSRGSFDGFDPFVESRPIKPTPPRSSFLGPLNR